MARRIAVVDLGTNSTRLLIADVDDDGTLLELERRTTVTRLGDGVDATGRLSDAATERVFAALADYRARIDRHDASTVVAVATSAVRDAANGEAFRATLQHRFDIDARTISGDEEARLTFRGATTARRQANEPTMVLDIGGGSTEYVVGHPRTDPTFHVSTRMGSVRQTERHLHADPPRPDELERLSEEADDIIAATVPQAIRDTATTGIAVAGTATSLAAIDQALDPYDSTKVHGYVLTKTACARMLAQLTAVPLQERQAITGLHPDRAPTIVAGATILTRSIEAFGLDQIKVSETDILHGAALSAASS